MDFLIYSLKQDVKFSKTTTERDYKFIKSCPSYSRKETIERELENIQEVYRILNDIRKIVKSYEYKLEDMLKKYR